MTQRKIHMARQVPTAPVSRYPGEELLRPGVSASAETRTPGVMLDHPGLDAIREAGVRMWGLDYRPPWRRWGETSAYLLFVVAKGRVLYPREGAKPLCARRDECLLLPPSFSKRMETHGRPVTAIWIHLKPGSLLLDNLGLPPEPRVHAFRTAAVLRVCTEQLIGESFSGSPDSHEICRALGDVTLHYLRRELNARQSVVDRDLRVKITRLLEDVNAQPKRPWRVAEMALALGMSEGHLQRKARALFGQSPSEIVQRIRLEKACALLRTTAGKLDAIAAEVGYGTAYAFSQAFQQHTGQRPGAYRRRMGR